MQGGGGGGVSVTQFSTQLERNNQKVLFLQPPKKKHTSVRAQAEIFVRVIGEKLDASYLEGFRFLERY